MVSAFLISCIVSAFYVFFFFCKLGFFLHLEEDIPPVVEMTMILWLQDATSA